VEHGAFRVGITKHLGDSERCLRIWRGHELLKLFVRWATMSDLDTRMTVLYHIRVGTVRCVCGKVYKAGGALTRHVEETEDYWLIWRRRYVWDINLLEEEILWDWAVIGPVSDIGLVSQEHILIQEGASFHERP